MIWISSGSFFVVERIDYLKCKANFLSICPSNHLSGPRKSIVGRVGFKARSIQFQCHQCGQCCDCVSKYYVIVSCCCCVTFLWNRIKLYMRNQFNFISKLIVHNCMVCSQFKWNLIHFKIYLKNLIHFKISFNNSI